MASDQPFPPDLFMKQFKELKRKSPPADLSSVIDLDKISDERKVMRYELPTDISIPSACEALTDSKDWHVYELASVPGAFIIRNPFREKFKKYFVSRCLADYSRLPNVSNLDVEPRLYEDIWACANATDADERCRKYLHKLRWVTLGYHYDWTKKIYVRDRRNDFPTDLSSLTQYIVHRVLGEEVKFNAEAAIVNYYHLDSSLSGHTDHSEFDLSAPLISISLGLPCVFMIGGQTKAQEPEAVFLRDGDVVIMSGKARMSYHAVPKVLPQLAAADEQNAKVKSCSKRTLENAGEDDSQCAKRYRSESEGVYLADRLEELKDDGYWSPFREYMHTSRININVRQVFEPGKGPADYTWPAEDTFNAVL